MGGWVSLSDYFFNLNICQQPLLANMFRKFPFSIDFIGQVLTFLWEKKIVQIYKAWMILVFQFSKEFRRLKEQIHQTANPQNAKGAWVSEHLWAYLLSCYNADKQPGVRCATITLHCSIFLNVWQVCVALSIHLCACVCNAWSNIL